MRIVPASLRTLLVLAALFATSLSSAQAQQVWIPESALLDNDAVRRVFAEGRRLESERNWAAVLTHYEQAVKNHPGHKQLERQLDTARRRFSLAKRYHDPSFVRSVRTMSTQQSLNLYNEVLSKIQLHYVGQPSWGQLVRYGVDNLLIAMETPEFRSRNEMAVNGERVDEFLRRLEARLEQRDERTRLDAEISATIAAEMARRELGLSESAVILEFVCGAANSLDPYSAFLTPDQYGDVMSQIEGNFVGLGIELKADRGALLIVNVIPGGPAAQGGLRPGDRITRVDGQDTKPLSTDAAADLLRGREGSYAELIIEPAGQQEPKRYRLPRRRVDVPSIEDAKLVDRQLGVAYFKLTSFQKTTADELDKALWDLHNKGMRTLIMDLRGNPGGLLPASVQVADRFVSRGVIVSTRGRNIRENYDYQSHTGGTWRVPLIVLIDHNSASASEIFAGAIHDHKRGVVIGQKSYGKGSVQGIFPLLGSEAGIRLTTAKFYSPSGKAISKNGVTPDIALRVAAKPDLSNPTEPIRDGVLDHAVQYARNQLSRR